MNFSCDQFRSSNGVSNESRALSHVCVSREMGRVQTLKNPEILCGFDQKEANSMDSNRKVGKSDNPIALSALQPSNNIKRGLKSSCSLSSVLIRKACAELLLHLIGEQTCKREQGLPSEGKVRPKMLTDHHEC